jgi:LysM repeat protein
LTPTTAAVAVATSAATVSSAPAAVGARYTVKQGDTLSSISRQSGIPVREIAQANAIPADAMLRTGQILQLPDGTWSTGLRIRVTRPGSGSTVRSPLVVEGTAATFESVIVVELVDQGASAPLAQATTRARNADVGEHGPFRAELALPANAAGRAATLRVYWTSPRDGSPADEVRIPVTIAPAA